MYRVFIYCESRCPDTRPMSRALETTSSHSPGLGASSGQSLLSFSCGPKRPQEAGRDCVCGKHTSVSGSPILCLASGPHGETVETQQRPLQSTEPGGIGYRVMTLATCYVNTECSELSLGAGKSALLCAYHHYRYWGPAMDMAGTTLTLGRDRQSMSTDNVHEESQGKRHVEFSGISIAGHMNRCISHLMR